MCFGGNKGVKEAREARAATERAERKRQRAIKLGQRRIEESFEQFNPAFFDTFRQANVNNFVPQLDDQFAQAQDQLTAALAGRGLLDSSVGASRLSDLTGRFNDERTAIDNRALDASQNFRSQIERQKTDLFSLNQASADPQGIAARARGESTALVAPQSFSPLGQVFASALQPLSAFVSADRNAVAPKLPFNQTPQLFTSPTASGSGQVIN